jgi:hypothetical protein
MNLRNPSLTAALAVLSPLTVISSPAWARWCFAAHRSSQGSDWYAAAGGATDAEARQKAIRACESGKAPPNSCKNTGAWCK